MANELVAEHPETGANIQTTSTPSFPRISKPVSRTGYLGDDRPSISLSFFCTVRIKHYVGKLRSNSITNSPNYKIQHMTRNIFFVSFFDILGVY